MSMGSYESVDPVCVLNHGCSSLVPLYSDGLEATRGRGSSGQFFGSFEWSCSPRFDHRVQCVTAQCAHRPTPTPDPVSPQLDNVPWLPSGDPDSASIRLPSSSECQRFSGPSGKPTPMRLELRYLSLRPEER